MKQMLKIVCLRSRRHCGSHLTDSCGPEMNHAGHVNEEQETVSECVSYKWPRPR